MLPSVAVAEGTAPEEVGGWAVINPETGKVHGVVVCTESVCGQDGEWGGVLRMEYMGCTDCILRKQTNATADGNVAGWHGSGEGTDVTYDGDEKGTYTIVQDSGDEKRTMTLVPGKTAADPDGMDLSTGIIEQRVERKFVEPQATARVTVQEDRVKGSELEPRSIEVEFAEWGYAFGYESVESALEQLESDVESVLASESVGDESARAETGLAADNQVETEPEPSGFVQVVRELTQRVVRFLARWTR